MKEIHQIELFIGGYTERSAIFPVTTTIKDNEVGRDR